MNPEDVPDLNAPEGIQLDVHAAVDTSDPAAAPVNYVAPKSTALSEDETQRILGRLPALTPDASLQTTFAVRDKTLPPPKTGTTEQLPFPLPEPPAGGPPKVAVVPLTVLRYSPMSDTDIAPELSVTFSQPMVAMATVDQNAQVVPVKLTPTGPGNWQWKGAQTLVFAPAERLPMATRFQAEVPAGTKSVNGGVLAKAVKWTFATPAPRLVQSFPSGVSVETKKPVIILGFDQRVDVAAMTKLVEMRVNRKSVKVRAATPEEIRADGYAQNYFSSAQADRMLALIATEELPLAADVAITVPKGAPSAEGPLTTPEAQSFAFKIYGPFEFVKGYAGEPCRPTDSVSLHFTNTIDIASMKDRVHIEPATPGVSAVGGGNYITIDGRKKANTKYTIKVDAGLKDQHGQELAKPASFSFKVAGAEPMMAFGKEFFATMTPDVPSIDLWAAGQSSVKVDVYKVEPKDWKTYRALAQSLQYYDDDEKKPIPGKLLRSGKVEIASPDELVPTPIDLKGALDGSGGNAVIVVTGRIRYRDKPVRRTIWVQMTRLALDAFDDATDVTAWVTDLASGEPVKGATVTLEPTPVKGTTDSDGFARMALEERNNYEEERVLVAVKGGDRTFLPGGFDPYQNGRWRRTSPSSSSTLTYVTDDRGMYKPGESVHIKGWVREIEYTKAYKLNASSGKSIRYYVRDQQGNEVVKGKADISSLGGFDFAFDLPKTMNLGHTYLQIGFRNPNGSDDKQETNAWSTFAHHNFQVQEFRRPEFEVSANVSDGVHIVGEPASATVKAAYYAGGALQGAPVNWTIVANQASFTPPGRDSFIFGFWEPWWHHYGWAPRSSLGGVHHVVQGATDSRGMHRVAITEKSVKPERATSIEATATVADVNRQRWTARASMLVHSATTYVGVKPERMFVDPNKALKLELIAVDLDGKPVANAPVHVTATRHGYVVKDGQYTMESVKTDEVTLDSKDKVFDWSFTPRQGGRYQIRAEVRDSKGRLNVTDLSVWVSGEKQPDNNAIAKQELTLIPSKKSYAAGETAEILVQSPVAKGQGIAVVGRNGILSSQRFDVVDGSAMLKLPLTKDMLPNVHLDVTVVGTAGEGKAKRPAHAGGQMDIAIATDPLRLTLDVVPRSRALSPGESTPVDITVKDANGKAVSGAEVALIVVDEAVLALSSFQLRDPLEVMTPNMGSQVHGSGIRDSVVIARAPRDGDDGAPMEDEMRQMEKDEAAPSMALAAPAPGGRMEMKAKRSSLGGGGRGGEADAPIEMRTDFSALAAFVPKLTTDGSGKVSTVVKLPDNLTRYRVMAVAASPVLFGKGESSVTARLPLMVRPSAPRFANFGDRFELPAVVQNQTDGPLDIDVVVRALNAEVPRAGVRVRVEGGQRAEVRFPVATVSPGTAQFQVGATSGKLADAADVKLPVWTPATSEAFATYGVLDGNAAIKQPVSAPADVHVETGGLTVSTSSTALQSLSDAMLYVARYPYDCTEQVSSRILAIVAMKDVLSAFRSPELPEPEKLTATVAGDIETLTRRQMSSGGFGFWDRERVQPYASIHAAHALVRAKAAGFAVPERLLTQSLAYARNVEGDMTDWWPEGRRYVVAYALAVRARAGDVDVARAKKVIAEVGVAKTSVETLGHLLNVAHLGKDAKLVEEIARELNRRVTETAGAAHFVTKYDDGAHLIMASDRRADAVVLGGMVAAKPDSDLIPKVIRGLMDGRRRGHWLTTQENVFVLLAVGEYFNAFEKTTPEFVARIWLGEKYQGEAGFHGRETVTREVQVPMKQLVANGHDLVLQKQGAGRMYYRIGLDYAPKSLKLDARDQGFEVTRVYEPIDDPSTVKRDADGTWRVKAGARVRVRLKMVAPAVRYFVALVDPMPAGFEAVNSALAVSEDVPSDDGELYGEDDVRPVRRSNRRTERYVPWWMRHWYDHQNMRDERVEAFADTLYAGVHEYTYVARATTPGDFVVPPTKAEEMYAPETFGRAASERVIVE